ncbi:hypothetical protein [Exiguobacterium sp. 17-1]|uniref:hypothetical protein n=1 Tax=Exiguobacterium sp. 17-1 TaxID=2931981 RepID=UPI001FFFF0E1|nr:hypothetical protein [Exiguobacterium sp. 17-1]MCK2156158.1 hypothetical protein [Exiguobacterium sp. 17-1]
MKKVEIAIRRLKQLITGLIVGVLCLTATIEVQAISKEEKQVLATYRSFAFGLTLVQVAKVMYGKSYKQHLTEKNGATVFKKKAIRVKNEQGYRTRTYAFFDRSKTLPTRMELEFDTKRNKSTYYLTTKALQFLADSPTGLRESTRTIPHITRIHSGQTERQLDRHVSGQGLGHVAMRWSWDYTAVQTKQERKKYKYLGQSKVYVFDSSNPHKQIDLVMHYDDRHKKYKVNYYSVLTLEEDEVK